MQLSAPFGGSWWISIQPSLDTATLATAAVALLIALTVFGLEPALRLTRTKDVRTVFAPTSTSRFRSSTR
ncbi:MAG TPA: hypothetical protein VNJ02_03830 [Vicinamibacterales bacterium]|nr:hypothetical protein [Vicinamibacterales bacterium]